MSWTQELYRVYEQQRGVDHNDGNVLLPISHSTANAQIEVTLRQDGSFVAARALTKEEGMNTIIPVTEDSGARGNGINPMPFADKLVYLCGDYTQYTGEDNEKYYQAYIGQLEKWHNSTYTHPAVNAVYAYLSRKTIMKDLINCHVLTLDETTGRLAEKVSIAGIAQEDAFVRFRVFGDCPETWLDRTLYDRFAAWYESESKQIGLCYATGENASITYKHPSKIRNTGDKAKLISANDDSGFTFRGRFTDKAEAISVSYVFSQKMHNALRWLIQRQGIHFDTMALLIWTSTLSDPPDIMNAAVDEDDPFDEPITPDTEPLYRDYLRKCIFGTKSFEITSKVMIMGVDAATTGRLSIALYEELEHSRLLESLFRWHAETSAMRYFSQKKRSCPNSFAVKEIVKCAYGVQNESGYLDVKPEIVKDGVLRLLPCITQGRRLPVDIVQNLVKKASEPLAFPYQKGDKHPDNHRIIRETACGMIRKLNIEQGKGVISMAYDPNETDRGYLYGCLLAIADAAEYASYEDEDKGKRITNARRYWSMFSKRPYTTWGIIEGQLREYMKKLGAKSSYYDRMFNEIMGKFNADEFENNAPLKPNYLLGYHHYNAEIYKKKEEE